jgi:phosphatidylinositol alpha-1,6-mannosyltransferase
VKVALLGSGVLPIPPPGWGAVERAIDGLSKGLHQLGIDVEVVNRVRGGRSIDEYRFALNMPSVLRRGKWDVLHASTPVIANAVATLGRDFVYTSHSRHWFGAHGTRERWGLYLERRACARAGRVIALTEEASAKISERLTPDRKKRVKVIPNGVDTNAFAPDWNARTGVRIIGVGAVHPRKRWHLAARAIASTKGAHLTIVGPVQDEDYAKSLKSLATRGKLELAGEETEEILVKRYSTSDIFLLPSGSELMSIAVMEAMASGLPVVGTTILSGEVEDGKTGFLTEEKGGEPEILRGLESRLTKLLENDGLRKRMGTAARAHAEENWAWPVVAAKVRDLYVEMLME